MTITGRARIVIAAFLCLGLWAGSAMAEQSEDVGDYVIHYNAFTTDTLAPEVARSYGIPRSGNRAMLNLTVLKKQAGLAGKPVAAEVSASAVNMNNQLRNIEMRQIRDGDAIYYVGHFGVSHQEVMDFRIEVRPKDTERTYTLEFRQRFFTR